MPHISEETLAKLYNQVQEMLDLIREEPLYKNELAQELGVSVRTIERHLKDGTITPNYLGKTKVFYKSKVLKQLDK